MAQNYIVSAQIEYPSGTPLSDVQVTLRQNGTNDSKTLNTNSSGQVVFNIGKTSDFPNGWSIGDVLTLFVIYRGFEAHVDHTIASTDPGGYGFESVVLTAVVSAPAIKLFNPQEFLTVLRMVSSDVDSDNGVDMQKMVTMAEGAQEELESDCETKFDSNDGDYYTQTDYFDDDPRFRQFSPTKRPIVSITSFHYNTSREGSADSWNATSLTLNTDYFKKDDTDVIRLARTSITLPEEFRKRGWRLIYTYGRATVPKDIKLLAIYETAIRMGLISMVKSKIKGTKATNMDFQEWFVSYRNKIINKYRNQEFINT